MEYLQIRHPPAFVPHIASHQAQAFGFNLPLAIRKEWMVITDKRVLLSVKEGWKYQTITMSIRPDQKHGTAYAIERN